MSETNYEPDPFGTPTDAGSSDDGFVIGSGIHEVLRYTGDNPTADGVVPDNQNLSAIAVKPYGTVFVWDTVLHVWDDSGSGGGSPGGPPQQVLAYTTTGPTADGLVPADQNSAAIAVKPNGNTYIWDKDTHVWDDV